MIDLAAALEDKRTPYVLLVQRQSNSNSRPSSLLEYGLAQDEVVNYLDDNLHGSDLERKIHRTNTTAFAKDIFTNSNRFRTTDGTAGSTNNSRPVSTIGQGTAPCAELYLVLKHYTDSNDRLDYRPHVHSVSARSAPSYTVLGDLIVPSHTTRARVRKLLKTPGIQSTLLTEVLKDDDIVHLDPDGDLVRKLNNNGGCLMGCVNGWLPNLAKLNCAIPNYTSPVSLDHATICPGCIKPRVSKAHETLLARAEYEDLHVDVYQQTVELSRLMTEFETIRSAKGYAGHYWNLHDYNLPRDALTASNPATGVYSEERVWEEFSEAYEPSPIITRHPATQETIKNLPLVSFSPYAEAKSDSCLICLVQFEGQQELARLPCGHLYCADGCIQNWLGEQNTCPGCRAKVGPEAEVDRVKQGLSD
ncbi:hypothetical protein MBLNU230_g8008t1 [Neophaeotheca triangularis]